MEGEDAQMAHPPFFVIKVRIRLSDKVTSFLNYDTLLTFP